LQLKKKSQILGKKTIILSVAIAGIVIGYFAFLKPSSQVKVDWNKFNAFKSPSVLIIEAPSEVSGIGKSAKVSVKLDTRGYIVNAVQANLKFDPKDLEVVSIDSGQSFCKFYPEKKYDNDKGLVKIACGSPYPGFKGESTIVTVEFKTKSFTTTMLSVEKESMVLANDGKGTNLLEDLDSKEIKIKAAF